MPSGLLLLSALNACSPEPTHTRLLLPDENKLLELREEFEDSCTATGRIREEIISERDQVLRKYGDPFISDVGLNRLNDWWCTPTPAGGQASTSTAFERNDRVYIVDLPKKEEHD